MKKSIVLIGLCLVLTACTAGQSTYLATNTPLPTPTHTPLPSTTTSAPTATDTPEPTTTNTPQPTDTPTITPTPEPVYTSGLDPELIAEVVAEFEAKTGMTVKEMMQYQKENGYFSDETGYHPEQHILVSYGTYIGQRFIPLDHLEGASSNDGYLCAFIAQDSGSGTVIPYIMGFTYKGTYYNTVMFGDVRERVKTGSTDMNGAGVENYTYSKMSEMVQLLSQVELGDTISPSFPTLAQIESMDDFDDLDETRIVFKDNVRMLLELVDSNYAIKMGEKHHPVNAIVKVPFFVQS